MAEIPTIGRDELKQKLDQGEPLRLVDALAPEKFRHSHLPGAINIPAARVRELAPGLLPDKNAEIITYCASYT